MGRRMVAVTGIAALIASIGVARPAAAQETTSPPAAVRSSVPAVDHSPAEIAPAADAPDPGSQQDDVEDRSALEMSFAQGNGKANDDNGFMKSLYQGKWYMPKKEAVRRCIIDRESNFDYEAVSRGGLYRGAYQMSRALAIGATWMMQKEVRKEMGDEFVAILKHLRQIPTHKWNRYWQDRAFWTVWRKGDGRRHWGSGARNCVRKARQQARQASQQ